MSWPPSDSLARPGPGDRKFGSMGDLERGWTINVVPVTEADVRRALTRLVGAHLAVHHRLPAQAAVADVYRMLCGPPRPEVSAAEQRARLKADRGGRDVSPWRD